MLFTQQEIQRLLEIVDYHSSFVAGSVLGKEVLSDYDRFILQKHGIDIEKIREGKETSYFEMYMWGKLSALLSDSQAKEITYEDFEKYIKRGQYIPLSKIEQYQYDVAKQKTYGHIKGLGDKIKQTVNGIVVEENQVRRAEYEKVIKEELERGVVDRKSVTSIVSEIGHKTEDWYRDWGRIVETEMQGIYNLGITESILNKSGGEALVFKETFDLACRHCIRLHLTNGIGSEPIIFKLSELIANGDNIDKKVNEWKATIPPEHPFCRCMIREIPKGYKWDEEVKKFTIKPEDKPKYARPKVKMTIGDKEVWV